MEDNYKIVMVSVIYHHESATGIHVYPPSWAPLPPPSPPYPSRLSQSTSFGCPASCIKLDFTYGNVYVSMLFSQIIPPSPSPTESKSLFFMSVSTPVFLPGESHGGRNLVGCSPCGRKESDTTERLHSLSHSWNLERQYWQSYMQGSKTDTDVKNRLLDSVGEGEGGMIWENSIETCILSYVK